MRLLYVFVCSMLYSVVFLTYTQYKLKTIQVMKGLYDKVKTPGVYIAVSILVVMVQLSVVSAEPSVTLQHTVTGTVNDAATGESLPGVTVMVQGTNIGAATNAEGEYSLVVPGPDAVLVFSFVGYETQRITVGDLQTIDVELGSVAVALDEMVVVGYGTVQRRDLTGSVERVHADRFQNLNLTQPTEMLAGTVTGLYSRQSVGAAGGASMQIRGENSITAGTSPLIVLNDVVYNGSLRDINPNDIETIDILKDASAAAVYGARAASGVVLITTKQGQIGRPTVTFNSRIGYTKALNREFGFMNPDEYIAYRQAHFRSDWERVTEPNYHWSNPNNLPDGVTIEDWRATVNNPNPDDTQEWLSRLNFFPEERQAFLAGHTVNWADEVMPGGIRQEADLSVSGGTDNARYYWSVGYQDNEGIRLGDQFAAFRTRLNVDLEVVDWLTVGVNAQYTSRDESAVLAGMGQANSPYSFIYHPEDGRMMTNPHGYVTSNPLLNYTFRDRDRKLHNAFGSLYAETTLPFGITHRLSFQPRIESLRDYQYDQPYLSNLTGGWTDSQASRDDFQLFEWTLDNLVTWDMEIGVHRFDVTLLHSAEQNEAWRTLTSNNAFRPTPVLGYSGLQFGINPTLTTTDEKITGDAMMARLNYILLDRYLFTASIRRDGYSAFGQENPRATFPALAFAWQISEERFFDVDLISDLKLRLSWGANGNRDIEPYQALAQLGSRQYYDGTNVRQGVFTSSLANPGLMWEETESINIGLDVGILDNRIDLNLDYYNATTQNLLVNRTLPRATGYSSVTTNIGELGNKGFEMTLRTVNVNLPDITWSSSLVFSLNRNEIKSLFGETGEYTLIGERREGEIPDFSNEWFIGQALDVVWDYDITGIWQLDEADEAAQYNLHPGDFKVRDLNGDFRFDALEEKVFLGHREPRYRLGFQNDITFLQNFSASVFLRADLGHLAQFTQSTAGPSTRDRRSDVNWPYWSHENPTNDFPRLGRYEGSMGQFGGGIRQWKDASFLRIQDVSLAYNLPVDLARRLQLQNLRIYGSIRNLATFTRWPAWDPEAFTSGGVSIPMPRTFTLGLSLSI